MQEHDLDDTYASFKYKFSSTAMQTFLSDKAMIMSLINWICIKQTNAKSDTAEFWFNLSADEFYKFIGKDKPTKLCVTATTTVSTTMPCSNDSEPVILVTTERKVDTNKCSADNVMINNITLEDVKILEDNNKDNLSNVIVSDPKLLVTFPSSSLANLKFSASTITHLLDTQMGSDVYAYMQGTKLWVCNTYNDTNHCVTTDLTLLVSPKPRLEILEGENSNPHTDINTNVQLLKIATGSSTTQPSLVFSLATDTVNKYEDTSDKSNTKSIVNMCKLFYTDIDGAMDKTQVKVKYKLENAFIVLLMLAPGSDLLDLPKHIFVWRKDFKIGLDVQNEHKALIGNDAMGSLVIN